MKKILFVNSTLTAGGSERVMTLLANEFSKRDYDVSMVLLYKNENDTYKLSDYVKLKRFNCEHRIKLVEKIKLVLELRKEIIANNYDYIVSFMQSINIITILATLGLNKKVIVSERCNPKTQRGLIKKVLEKVLYRKSGYLVVQTEQVKEMFDKKIQEKSVVIPNPVDEDIPSAFEGIREKRIVAVGRLTKQKNFSMLIKTFQLFSNMHPDYFLEIYGQGPLKNELEELANTLGINDKVLFKGYVSNVREKMRAASLYISTSNYEGISNSMIEALAMGIPTICTDCPVGGAALMIKNNYNGVLIPVGDQDALLIAMNKIINDPNFMNKISSNALKIKQEYSIKKIADRWEKIL